MGVRFQSMGNCVAKVQQHPFAGILFILFHDSALDVAARVRFFRCAPSTLHGYAVSARN